MPGRSSTAWRMSPGVARRRARPPTCARSSPRRRTPRSRSPSARRAPRCAAIPMGAGSPRPRTSPTTRDLVALGGGDGFRTPQAARGVHVETVDSLLLAADGHAFEGYGIEPIDFRPAPALDSTLALRRFDIPHNVFGVDGA